MLLGQYWGHSVNIFRRVLPVDGPARDPIVHLSDKHSVMVTEHDVLRWQRTVAIVDVIRRTQPRVTHASHIVSLAAYAKYWEPQFVQYKCVTTVKDTF